MVDWAPSVPNTLGLYLVDWVVIVYMTTVNRIWESIPVDFGNGVGTYANFAHWSFQNLETVLQILDRLGSWWLKCKVGRMFALCKDALRNRIHGAESELRQFT